MGTTFNAIQLIDALYDIDVRLYEQVLDTIAREAILVGLESGEGTWERDDEGNMVLVGDYGDDENE